MFTTRIEYEEALISVITKIESFNPNYLIIAFGADTSSIGGFRLELEDYKQIGIYLSKLRLPTIITQEGGYNLEIIPKIIHNFLQSFNF